MKKIYIIRHGETEFNRRKIVQGSGVDTSLNENGQAQGNAFFKYYKDIPFEAVLTSKLKRTHETVADFINQGIKWEQFAEINEMSWGVHEGKESSESMRADYKLVNEEWAKGNFDVGLEGGETITELAARCEAFKQILLERSETTILVCAHGRLIRCLMCILLDEPLTKMDEFGHSNTGLYQLKLENNQFSTVKTNDTEHLDNQSIVLN